MYKWFPRSAIVIQAWPATGWACTFCKLSVSRAVDSTRGELTALAHCVILVLPRKEYAITIMTSSCVPEQESNNDINTSNLY